MSSLHANSAIPRLQSGGGRLGLDLARLLEILKELSRDIDRAPKGADQPQIALAEGSCRVALPDVHEMIRLHLTVLVMQQTAGQSSLSTHIAALHWPSPKDDPPSDRLTHLADEISRLCRETIAANDPTIKPWSAEKNRDEADRLFSKCLVLITRHQHLCVEWYRGGNI